MEPTQNEAQAEMNSELDAENAFANESIMDKIELLVQAMEFIVHIPENQKYLDAASEVEAWLATHRPEEV